MRTLIQKIHVEEQYSFACRQYSTPEFETNWHKHEECELILITEGYGTALIGDYVGDYRAGDVFFLQSNLPHWFRKAKPQMTGSAVVLHFISNFWGNDFLQLPEMKPLARLLHSSNNGLQLQKKLQKKIASLILEIEKSSGPERIYLLLQSLQQMCESKQVTVITKAFNPEADSVINPAIEKVFAYSFKHFLEPVTLSDVAAIANMTIPTFCRFFKRNIKKSYFDFLKELRIGHACKLLKESNEPILDICYASGYNSWAHFSKQFRQVKQMPPGAYRRQYKNID
ncbi:MAG TPA: AraC family transcriptional regulator [Ferruginibacter sp.]|nr:AraC family transcriptional regulator [Ferruginibacter sp.]HMP21131.1 AraC family transcriptional regulator [Ferruginibacter sp.]